MSFWSYLTSTTQDNSLSSWFSSLIGLGQDGRMASFTMAIVALSAKLSKADGHVSRDEVAAFKRIFTIPPEQEDQIGQLYNLARQDTAGFESYARQIGNLFKDEPERLREVLTALLLIAKADGTIDEAEHLFLAEVATLMGVPNAEFQAMAYEQGDTFSFDPYSVLGLEPHAVFPEVRKAYIEQIKRYHPDVWAQTCNNDTDCLDIAVERTALINKAYQTIREQQ